MSREDTILRIAKKLKNKENEPQFIDLLNKLRRFPPNPQLLQKSHLELVVKRLIALSANKQVVSLAKVLASSWKAPEKSDKPLPAAGLRARAANEALPADGPRPSTPSTTCAPSAASTPSTSPLSGEKAGKGTRTKGQPKKMQVNMDEEETLDPIRKLGRKLLADALGTEPDLGVGRPFLDSLAEKIEEQIFLTLKETVHKYKSHIRDKVICLRDKHNPTFRINVVNGHIRPHVVAMMSFTDMASNQLRMTRNQVRPVDDIADAMASACVLAPRPPAATNLNAG